MKRVIEVIATGFYFGRAPVAPGTFGTLVGIPLVYLFLFLGPMGYLIASVLFVIFSIVIAELHERKLGHHDAKEIVIDEVAGFVVAMAWIPFEWSWVILAFLLFRFFDAIKPFPISVLDKKVGGGFGVVVDDIAAGIIVNLILQVVYQKGLLPI